RKRPTPIAPRTSADIQAKGGVSPARREAAKTPTTNGRCANVVIVMSTRRKRDARGLLPIARAPTLFGGGTLDMVEDEIVSLRDSSFDDGAVIADGADGTRSSRDGDHARRDADVAAHADPVVGTRNGRTTKESRLRRTGPRLAIVRDRERQ